MNKIYTGTFVTEVEVMDEMNQVALNALRQFGFTVTLGNREDKEGIVTQEYVCQEAGQKFTPWPEYLKAVKAGLDKQKRYFDSTCEEMGNVQ